MGSHTTEVGFLPATGRIEGTSVPELIWSACQSGFAGSIVFQQDDVQKVVYLSDGTVQFAASSDPEDRLGMLLLRRGQISLAALMEAGQQISRKRRLGQLLVAHEQLTHDEMTDAVAEQLRQIVLSLFQWQRGDWRISQVKLPSDESILVRSSARQLILDGVRRMGQWSQLRQVVGGPRAWYRLKDNTSRLHDGLHMAERSILEQLEAPSRVDTLCREIYAPSYEIYRSLWALSILDLVERLPTSDIPQSGLDMSEGSIEAAGGTPRLLMDLGNKRFTGTVRLYDGPSEGSVFFRDGRIEFAISNDGSKSLVSHLLRRGVISDRDHEEAARRLVTGKRIGTLLAERGAIEFDELTEFVREQILEVAKSLATIEQGEYELSEGLPCREEIVLDITAEELVMSAAEGDHAFQPIWGQLEQMDSLFRLTPDYLRRLDRMRLRPAVWDFVALLDDERTLGELLDAREECDFDICRWIYALQLVGVVERVSSEEILERARRSKSDEAEALETEDTGRALFGAVGLSGAAAQAANEDGNEVDDQDDVAVSEHAETAAEMAPELFARTDDSSSSATDDLPDNDALIDEVVSAHEIEFSGIVGEDEEKESVVGSDDEAEDTATQVFTEEELSDAGVAQLISETLGEEVEESDEDHDGNSGEFSEVAFDSGQLLDEQDEDDSLLSGPIAELEIERTGEFEDSVVETVETPAPSELIETQESPKISVEASESFDDADLTASELSETFIEDSDESAESAVEESAEDEDSVRNIEALSDEWEEAMSATPEPSAEGEESSEASDAVEAGSDVSETDEGAPSEQHVSETSNESDSPESGSPESDSPDTDSDEVSEEPRQRPRTRYAFGPGMQRKQAESVHAVETPSHSDVVSSAVEAARASLESQADQAEIEESGVVSEVLGEPSEAFDSSETTEGQQSETFEDSGVIVDESASENSSDESSASESHDVTDANGEIQQPISDVESEQIISEVAAFASSSSSIEMEDSSSTSGSEFGFEEDDFESVQIDEEVYVAVDRFNRRHRVIYHQLRFEIGAGVRNYVKTCQRRLGDLGAPLDGLKPDREGSFDRDKLARALASSWNGSPHEPLDALIHTELGMVRDLLSPERMREIESALDAAEELHQV